MLRPFCFAGVPTRLSLKELTPEAMPSGVQS